jgi:hypothetical protein
LGWALKDYLTRFVYGQPLDFQPAEEVNYIASKIDGKIDEQGADDEFRRAAPPIIEGLPQLERVGAYPSGLSRER